MSTKNQYKNFQFNTKKNKDKKEYFVGIKSFLNDERFHKTFGLFLYYYDIFIFCIHIIFIYMEIRSKYYRWKVIGFVFNGEESEIHNWLGKFGAYTAHLFLKVWYGVSSYIFVFFYLFLASRYI